MEKLREDYIDGEKFFAEDMNAMTHTINKLDDGIVIVEDLPDTGETGVIYVTPNFSDSDSMFNRLYFLPLEKSEGQHYVSFSDTGLDDDTYLRVGDIIKVNNTGETAWVPTSIDLNRFEIDPVEGDVYGILSSIKTENNHYYKITGIYDIDVPDGEFVMSFHKGKVLTFSEIQSDDEYMYSCKKIPSLVGIHSAVLTGYLYDAGLPLLETDPNEFEMDENSATTFNIEVGDKFRYVGPVQTGSTITVPISVDEDKLKCDLGRGVYISGITSYTSVKANQCYEVTGIYDAKMDEMEQKSAKEYYGFYYDFKIATFREIENDPSITEEKNIFSSFRYYSPFFRIDDEHCKKYVFSDGAWIGI